MTQEENTPVSVENNIQSSSFFGLGGFHTYRSAKVKLEKTLLDATAVQLPNQPIA